MNKKKLIILISIIISLAILVCIGLFALSGNKDSKIADKLDLGEKYLEELEYEKALAVYKEILEIDPKNADAYLGMAEVYIAMGEYEEALKVLEEGYEETGEEVFVDRMEEIEALNRQDTHEIGPDDIVCVQDIIWYSEATRDDVPIDMLEKVPDSSVTYVAVGGYGNPNPMGVPFQNYAVGVDANPKEGYRYVRSESPTIEFYEYDYNESKGYEVPWFLVPESGQHYIYIYYEPIGEESQMTEEPQATPEPTLAPEEEITGGLADDYVIDWIDPNLEAAMRRETGIYDRDITYGDVKDITSLYLSHDWDADEEAVIRDISALGCMTNLGFVQLQGHAISDISVLANLTNIYSLDVSFNVISDISVLSNLTNLTDLKLSGNAISDISVLSGLTDLQCLELAKNQITDISALSNLTKLRMLILNLNAISDISAIGNLTELVWLELSNNNITDISVLSNLTNLVDLWIWDNDITDYSPVSHVPNKYY